MTVGALTRRAWRDASLGRKGRRWTSGFTIGCFDWCHAREWTPVPKNAKLPPKPCPNGKGDMEMRAEQSERHLGKRKAKRTRDTAFSRGRLVDAQRVDDPGTTSGNRTRSGQLRKERPRRSCNV